MTAPITNADAIRHAQVAGFRGDGLVTIIAIAHAESGLIPDARNRNADGSIDRGILQINDRWHPEVSEARADDPASAFVAGFQISRQGTAFTPWSTYISGAYTQFLDAIRKELSSMTMQLDRPFHTPPGVNPQAFVTQAFGVHNPGVEPFGYKYPDTSIWYDDAPGTTSGNWHNGVDYGLMMGVPLFAPADGTVVFAGAGAPSTRPIDTRGFGNCLVIRHMPLGIYTLYSHLSAFEAAVNQHVARGDEIARVGSTGNSSGPHLHWSVIRMSDIHYVDPARFMETPMQPSVHVVSFTVTADADDDPVRVFDGPSRQFTALRVVPPGSTLPCTAWSYGEPRWDKSAGHEDARWYRLADGGWVASARVQGNAPSSTPLP